MFDTSDPAVLWLVIMNLVMGAAVLICCILLAGAVARELLVRMRRPAASPHAADDHSFAVPELGLTMADGGEREDKPSRKHRRR